MLVNLSSFSGEVPKVAQDKLPASSATIARDCRLTSGDLEPWRLEAEKHVVRGQATPIKSLYYYTPGSKYLCFTEDTDVVSSPIADDQYGRVYISNSSGVYLAISSGITEDAYGRVSIALRPLGIPAPSAQPGLAGSGGVSDISVVRSVVYTFVSDLGEEGPPSTPSASTTMKQDDSISVTGMSTAQPTGQNISKKRIYVTTIGSSGAVFQFWKEVDLNDASESGVIDPLQLGETLPSTYWVAPPDDLQGLVALSGNFMAGFRGNEVWFSEPNYPHAWPVGYMLTFNHDVVALGVDGTTLVVMTAAHVYLVTAQSPDTATVATFPDAIPCASKRSVAMTPAGVVFAGWDALYVANSSGVGKLTQEYWSRPQFQSLAPNTIHGAFQNGQYVFFYNDMGGYVLSIGEAAEARLSRLSFYATAVAATRPDDELTIAYPSGGDQIISWFDADINRLMSYCWRSRLIVAPEPVNFSCLRVTAQEFESSTPVPMPPNETSGALGYSMVGQYSVGGDWWTSWFASLVAQLGSLRVHIYAGGELKHSVDISSEDDILALPSGFLERKWQIEMEGNVTVMGVMMATSVTELMTAPVMPGASV